MNHNVKMNSREIAYLTDKPHVHIVSDIKKMKYGIVDTQYVKSGKTYDNEDFDLDAGETRSLIRNYSEKQQRVVEGALSDKYFFGDSVNLGTTVEELIKAKEEIKDMSYKECFPYMGNYYSLKEIANDILFIKTIDLVDCLRSFKKCSHIAMELADLDWLASLPDNTYDCLNIDGLKLPAVLRTVKLWSMHRSSPYLKR